MLNLERTFPSIKIFIRICIVLIVHCVQFSNDTLCPIGNEIVHLSQDVDTLNHPLESPIYSFRSICTSSRLTRRDIRQFF